jgi:diguanylate cyclase (GGDEF)-like protein/PAS domain S-box-containing protein
MRHNRNPNKIFHGYGITILWLLVILYFATTLVLSVGYELNALYSKHQARGELIHRGLVQRVTSMDTVLTSIVGLRHASDNASYAELSSFSQEMLKVYPYITAIIHMPRVVGDKRAEFEADMHKQGFVSFKMEKRADSFGEGPRLLSYHLPVSFVEPMNPHSARMLGYDLTSNRAAHTSIYNSVQNDKIVTLGPISGSSFKQDTYFVLKPVYQGRYPPENIEDRLSMFDGMDVLVIEPESLVKGLAGSVSQLNISLTPSLSVGKEDKVELSPAFNILRYFQVIDIHGASFNLSVDQRLSNEMINWKQLLIIWVLSIFTLLLVISVYRNKRKTKIQEAEAEAAMAAEEERFAHVIQTAFDAVIISDENRTILSWNRQASDLFDYEQEEVLGQNLFQVILTPSSIPLLNEELEPLIQDYSEHPKGIRLELEGKDKNGRVFPLDLAISCSRIGALFTISVFARDITERKKWDEKIRLLAYNDPLTQLPNRQAFKERVWQAISTAIQRDTIGAVLYLDLDEFKRINDTLGHNLGDMLLVQVTKRLESHIRSNDILFRNSGYKGDGEEEFSVARLGGDEFTVLLEDIQKPEIAGEVANRIKDTIAGLYNVGGHEVHITPSIGIALFPQDGSNVDELLKNADTAMYHAKRLGKNNCQFYSDDMNIQAATRLKLEGKLRNALLSEEFSLYYQPQIDIKTNEIVSAEALLRWNQPELGMVSPAEFIPIAEETGMILELGEWVLNQACMQAKLWQMAGLKPIRIAVNLSSIQFMQKDLASTVAAALEDNELDPKCLELEITESIIMRNINDTISTLSGFKEMGIKISVDDFGTGYSSLSYLKRLPLDTIKIDRAFIRDIPNNEDDMTITSAIIALAKNLGLTVVAEGVESELHIEFLKQLACEKAQGFLISRPLPAEQMSEILQYDNIDINAGI